MLPRGTRKHRRSLQPRPARLKKRRAVLQLRPAYLCLQVKLAKIYGLYLAGFLDAGICGS
jgi:hypothetical protein